MYHYDILMFETGKTNQPAWEAIMMQSSFIEDFYRFRSEPSAEMRHKIVGSICDQFDIGGFTEKELVVAKDLLSYLASDVEKSIRKLLSERLKNSTDAPHDAIMKLAQDVPEVATPVLQHSVVLTDEDLVNIIQTIDETEKLISIARRQHVSDAVSYQLVATKQENVAQTLMQNPTASISDNICQLAMKTFSEASPVLETMVQREGLSIQVAERLITLVSTKMQQQLSKQHNIPIPEKLSALVDSREHLTLGLTSGQIDKTDTFALVEHLHQHGKLSHSIILRALCRNDITFFQAALAKRAAIPTINAQKLVSEGSYEGFLRLYDTAEMPESMREASYHLLQILREMAKKGSTPNNGDEHIILQIIAERGYDKSLPNMRYLMTLISAQ